MIKKNYILILSLIFIVGCGGGETVFAPAKSSEPAVVVNYQDKSSLETQKLLPDSSDNISMSDFWSKQALSEFTVTRNMSGYFYSKTKNLERPIYTDPARNIGGSNTVTIFDQGHGAKSGDWVLISSIASPVNGILPENINKMFVMSVINNDKYEINVTGVVSVKSNPIVNSNIQYKYNECLGTQTVKQTKASETVPITYFDSIESLVSTYTVNTTVNGCSPSTSTFKTIKYFAKNNPRSGYSLPHPLLGERISDGVYSTFNKTFDLPAVPLKSGDKGQIGVLMSYLGSPGGTLIGKSVLTYIILKDSVSSVFIVINTENFDSNNTLILSQEDVYAKNLSINSEYNLIKSTIKYNNDRKNEIIIM